MFERTHSMKVKSVVLGSMLMGRGLAAPQRTQSGRRSGLIKWNELRVAALSVWDGRSKGSSRVRIDTNDVATNVAVVYVNQG